MSIPASLVRTGARSARRDSQTVPSRACPAWLTSTALRADRGVAFIDGTDRLHPDVALDQSAAPQDARLAAVALARVDLHRTAVLPWRVRNLAASRICYPGGLDY
jgi:hypothetical protein